MFRVEVQEPVFCLDGLETRHGGLSLFPFGLTYVGRFVQTVDHPA
jgi:hypothetical protein